ncbi:GNAT family N-acetyltransferase [Paenibacillus radicis (ex Xue et al. 2023)]|uniref:GNAT family N-acetyltransferase n=1 Tax=Paenibacillus radicis (ex Xue et al. 2023) TaxID=2972489 RepID=A0ABT1YFE3_9BACL|nr:GNAT family N-acetyltransferase [Paenibacillus radicis (ex Xue et al. 2023)]MCR8631913.1 GNAT family N-acetyltransferase [Paenibacillus radicis (ex Xue et al. 2023)]
MYPSNNNLSNGTSALIIQLEKLAFNTWPAASTVAAEHWVYRASGGITKRANSVWTAAGEPMPHGDWLEEAVRFYSEHGLPVRYHISDASPKQLDLFLETQGYLKETPCTVMIAQADKVIEKMQSSAGHDFRITISSQHNDDWLNHFLHMEGFGEERRAFYHKLFADIEPTKGFFTLGTDGLCAAVGTSIIQDGWAGLINVAVNPELRGRGLGHIILHELAVWSRVNGAEGLYLQVINDNEPATKLYTKAGFVPLYQYHYRCKNN